MYPSSVCHSEIQAAFLPKGKLADTFQPSSDFIATYQLKADVSVCLSADIIIELPHLPWVQNMNLLPLKSLNMDPIFPGLWRTLFQWTELLQFRPFFGSLNWTWFLFYQILLLRNWTRELKSLQFHSIFGTWSKLSSTFKITYTDLHILEYNM